MYLTYAKTIDKTRTNDWQIVGKNPFKDSLPFICIPLYIKCLH